MVNFHPAVVEATREIHPEGTRVELVAMKDEQAPPVGTKGTVQFVDDMAIVHVQWETGSTLGLVPGVDKWQIIKEETA